MNPTDRREQRLQSYKKARSEKEIYERVLAPTLYEFVLWVLQEALQSRKKRRYFLARDGYQMYLAAQQLCKQYDLDIECMLTKSRGHAMMLTRAIAETGEIINIDGKGNRLAALAFGKKRVFIVAGVNKLCDDFDSALYRARNVAATQNATRFDVKTPCKIDGKCHDCRSPQRICNALLVLWGPMMEMESVEVVLINEELGM